MKFQDLKMALALSACGLAGGCVSYPRQQPVTTPMVVQQAPIGAPVPFPVQPPPGSVVVPSGQVPAPPCNNCNPVPPPPPGPIVPR